jgi:hypothetical protein
MANDRNVKRSFLVAILIILLIIILPLFASLFYHSITQHPFAINGQINLSEINPTNTEIRLDGQWRFYWQRFIISEPENDLEPDLIINVPDDWSEYEINGVLLPAKGYGSYQLTLSGLDYQDEITIYIPDFGSAYRVFIDGQLSAENGILSKNQDEIFSVTTPLLSPILLNDNLEHVVTIEVATTRFSGLYMTPIISDYSTAAAHLEDSHNFLLMLFGIAVFGVTFMFALYLSTYSKKIFSFWLPLLLMFLLLRITFTSDLYTLVQPIIYFNLPYESTTELMYLSTFVLKYLMIYIIQENAGVFFSKSEKRGFLIYFIVLYLIFLLTPREIYNVYLSLIVPSLTYVLDIHLISRVYRGRKTIKPYGMTLLWGTALVMAAVAAESFYLYGIIYWDLSLILPTFLTLFIIIIGWTSAKRIVNLQEELNQSALRFEFTNIEIALQKEYFDVMTGKMDEIRVINHDFHHFIGTMQRLVEAGNLADLQHFLAEYGEKTLMEQLPVFCENMVANSIIGHYYSQAKKAEIGFEVQAHIPKEAAMSDSDLCIVIGNALENALDACKTMDSDVDKPIISFQVTTANSLSLFKVVNTYDGNVRRVNKKIVTTKKGPGHGFGLQNIHKVVDRYGGDVHIDAGEHEFVVMVSIPLKI